MNRLSADPVRPSPAFAPNLGQWQHDARFVTSAGGMTAFLQDRGLVLSLHGNGEAGKAGTATAIRLGFAAAENRRPRGEQRLGGTHNYFLGSDPSRWQSNVPRYGKVRWHAPWPGIDVILYHKDDHLEYDVEIETGADLAKFEIEVTGARELSLGADGSLIIHTVAGKLHQPAPTSWVVDSTGGKSSIDVDFELRGGGRFGLSSKDWNGEQQLVVDPGLIWSTYLG